MEYEVVLVKDLIRAVQDLVSMCSMPELEINTYEWRK